MQLIDPDNTIEGHIKRAELEYFLLQTGKRNKVPRNPTNSKVIAISTLELNKISDIFERQRYKDVVQSCIDELEKKTCLRFIERSTERSFLNFTYTPRGCLAGLGQQEGSQEIKAGPKCLYKGTMLHMMLHPLGFLHEHTRADRNAYIKINTENVEPGMMENFEKYDNPIATQMPYDYQSIMHVPMTFFSSNGLPTLEPTSPNFDRNDLGQRDGLSEIDVKKINKVYKCTQQSYPNDVTQQLPDSDKNNDVTTSDVANNDPTSSGDGLNSSDESSSDEQNNDSEQQNTESSVSPQNDDSMTSPENDMTSPPQQEDGGSSYPPTTPNPLAEGQQEDLDDKDDEWDNSPPFPEKKKKENKKNKEKKNERKKMRKKKDRRLK